VQHERLLVRDRVDHPSPRVLGDSTAHVFADPVFIEPFIEGAARRKSAASAERG
jgi:hypothetical protein